MKLNCWMCNVFLTLPNTIQYNDGGWDATFATIDSNPVIPLNAAVFAWNLHFRFASSNKILSTCHRSDSYKFIFLHSTPNGNTTCKSNEFHWMPNRMRIAVENERSRERGGNRCIWYQEFNVSQIKMHSTCKWNCFQVSDENELANSLLATWMLLDANCNCIEK